MIALILAAGEGTRFFESGANVFKQVYKHDNEPIITRIVRQLYEIQKFTSICVVLGQNEQCNKAIKQALEGYQINYVINKKSREDNNFLSLMEGLDSYKTKFESDILVIESDCIFYKSDLISLVSTPKEDGDIVWANIGNKNSTQAGGILFSNKKIQNIHQIDEIRIIKNPLLDPVLEQKYNFILKMYGLTFFSVGAVKKYIQLANNYKSQKKIYFHQIIIENISSFINLSVKISDDSMSFNTLIEYNHKKNTY